MPQPHLKRKKNWNKLINEQSQQNQKQILNMKTYDLNLYLLQMTFCLQGGMEGFSCEIDVSPSMNFW